VYWYQSPSPLKLMIDRLVCADGGNLDPTSTGGKDAALAGLEGSRRALSDWLDWMGFIDAGFQARLDRFIGYYEPYANSHEALDKDFPLQEEVRDVARSVIKAVVELRAGRLQYVQPTLQRPRAK
jgi:multimeric flavodoxin WrbA